MPREQQTSEKVQGNIIEVILYTEEEYVMLLYTNCLQRILF